MSDQEDRIKALAREAAKKSVAVIEAYGDRRVAGVNPEDAEHIIADAIRTALKETAKPTAKQAAWVIGQFMEHRDCTFSRKIEIMYPEDGGALHAMFRAGGQALSNALVEAEKFHEALIKIRDGSCDCAEFEQREDLASHGQCCPRRIASEALEA